MLRRALAACLVVLALTLLTLSAFAGEKELQQCTISLQEANVKTSVVAQTRDAIEGQLAKALRANQELGQEYDKLALHIQGLNKKIAELEKGEAKDEKKKPAKAMKPDFDKDAGQQ